MQPTMQPTINRILGVGVACLDIVNIVSRYPLEDAEIRATDQIIARGGNAPNTLTVLQQYNDCQCDWVGVLGDKNDQSTAAIRADLVSNGIGHENAVVEPHGHAGTSYITLSAESGSRTIVHYRKLPDYSLADFRKLDLVHYRAVHFEGHVLPEVDRMVRHVRSTCPADVLVTVELEKRKDSTPDIAQIDADIFFFSSYYVDSMGYKDPVQFLEAMRQQTRAQLVVSWGKDGAYCLEDSLDSLEGPAAVHHIPAIVLTQPIVDSIGAGDTLHAGFIHAVLNNAPLSAALKAGVHLAGTKCTQRGFESVVSRAEEAAKERD